MATGATLITLEPSPVNETILMAIAAWAAEPIRAVIATVSAAAVM